MTEHQAPAAFGNLIGYLNLKKRHGDDRPLFQGKLTLPGQPSERGFALWAHSSERTGETLLSGRAGDSPTAQIDSFAKPSTDPGPTLEVSQRDGAQGLTIDPHTLVLFTNKSKDSENPSRPDYFGYYNAGAGELMRLAAWARTDRNGRAILSGSVQPFDRPRDAAMESPAARAQDVSPPSPEPARPEPNREFTLPRARAQSRSR